MARFLLTDYDFPDIELEKALFRDAGFELATAQCRSEQDVIEAARGCAGVLVQHAPINDRVLDARPEIRIASRLGAGYDTIDVEAARRHGVWVANSPDYGMGEVSTHALAMALALIRHLPAFDRDVRAGRWAYHSTGPLRRAREMTLGILGLGRIGKRMAEISHACFGRVIACDPYIDASSFPAYVERVDRDALFRNSDVLTLHVPLTAETRSIVNAKTLALMKPDAFLVNTARGAVVDIDALAAALDADKLAGAGIDVLPREPIDPAHPLISNPRVILTPHAAFYSLDAERELRRKAAQNLIDWARTGRPTYVVVEGSSPPPLGGGRGEGPQ